MRERAMHGERAMFTKLGAALLGAMLIVTPTWAQTEEDWKRRVAELEGTVKTLSEQLQAAQVQLEILNASVGDPDGDGVTALEEEVERVIQDRVALKVTAQGQTRPIWMFNKLRGGLLFTGYLRSRFEWRANNLDFNWDNEPGANPEVDDEGVRMSGRFRLGFGTQLYKDISRTDGPRILALTEFQAIGDFANNTFVVQPSTPTANGSSIGVDPLISPQPYGTVGFYQGFMLFDDFFIEGEKFDVSIGRQEVAFGSEFIFGTNDFYEGTTHDGLRLSYATQDESWKIDALFLIEANTDTAAFDLLQLSDFDQDHLYGAHLTWIDPSTRNDDRRSLEVDAYALFFNGRGADSTSFGLELATGSSASFFDNTIRPLLTGQFWTLGTRAFWMAPIGFTEEDTLRLNLELALQTGEGFLSDVAGGAGGINPLLIGPAANGGPQRDAFGYAIEFIANYEFSLGESKPMLTLAYYHASGAEDAADDLGFQPLFINRHFSRLTSNPKGPQFPGGGRYGNMDVMPLNNIHLLKVAFSNKYGSKAALDSGRSDWELGLSYVLGIVDESQGYQSGIFGHEIDLFAVYTPEFLSRGTDYLLRISANLSVFIPEDGASSLSQSLFFANAGAGGNNGNASDDAAFAFYLQALIAF